MVDARLGIFLEPRPEKGQQVFQRFRLGGMVMGPEGPKLSIVPDAVEIFEATLVMRITFDIVEKVARPRSGSRSKPLPGSGTRSSKAGRPDLRACCKRACVTRRARVPSAMPRIGRSRLASAAIVVMPAASSFFT